MARGQMNNQITEQCRTRGGKIREELTPEQYARKKIIRECLKDQRERKDLARECGLDPELIGL